MRVPARFIARDLGIAAAAAALVWFERGLDGDLGVPERALQVAAGIAATVGAALFHEWGHLLGSLFSGARVRFPKRTLTLLLFDFDVSANSREQFLAMSFGGYLGSLLGLVVLALALPPTGLAGYLAWIGAGGGMLATLILEAPVTVRVLRGDAPPPALLTVADGDD